MIYESCRRSMYLKTYVTRTYVFILIHNKRQFEIDDLSISELILKLAAYNIYNFAAETKVQSNSSWTIYITTGESINRSNVHRNYVIFEKYIWEATTVHTSFDVQVFIIEVHTYSIVKKKKNLSIYEKGRHSLYFKKYITLKLIFFFPYKNRQY
jgi:hypothetical protein